MANEQMNFPPNTSLMIKLQWLQANAESNGEYTLTIDGDENIGPQKFSFSGQSNITVRLTTSGGEGIISFLGAGSLFTIDSGITLILEDGITLCGNKQNTSPLVWIDNGGKLIMNTGAKIKANFGGGVFVDKNGNFLMSGGVITGNVALEGGGVVVFGSFTMTGGEIFGNKVKFHGGGVSVHGNFIMHSGKISGNIITHSDKANGGAGISVTEEGSFTMAGGEISGNETDFVGGGVFVDSGNFTMTGGIIFGNISDRAGGGVYIDTKGTFSKTGGTIYGKTGEGKYRGNIVPESKYNNIGYAVYVFFSERSFYHRENTSGPDNNLNSNDGNGWIIVRDGREASSSSCYIATAVYGSYDCPQVWTLRRFRDNELANNILGCAFIKLYYSISPTIVELFGNLGWFTKFSRGKLDRLVQNLKEKGYKDTPYNDMEK